MLDALDGPLERIVVTHMHPDHVGGARDIAELTGAPVSRGGKTTPSASVPGVSAIRSGFVDYWVSHGMPDR